MPRRAAERIALAEAIPDRFYAIYALAWHLIAVVLTELHEGGSIISAMFTGAKLLNRPPEDR